MDHLIVLGLLEIQAALCTVTFRSIELSLVTIFRKIFRINLNSGFYKEISRRETCK